MNLILPQRNLFVCQGNVTRSFWAERVFRKIAENRGFSVGGYGDSGYDLYVASAGIFVNEADKPQSVQLIPDMLSWFGRVSPMEKFVRRELVRKYAVDRSKLVPVYIDDNAYGKEDIDILCDVLFRRLEHYVPTK